MPATSKAQLDFMRACAHGANYKGCPPQNVAKDFEHPSKDLAAKMHKQGNGDSHKGPHPSKKQ